MTYESASVTQKCPEGGPIKIKVGDKFKAMFGGSPPMEWMLEASVKHRDYFSAGRREVRA